jgi:protein-S-isoprenylcysteine O-methyltransferase Ste14
LVTAALDPGRFRYSSVPPVAKGISYAVLLFGCTFAIYAVYFNRYASSHVRIQEDRGHSVITGGPYKIVRHPMYTGYLISAPAVALFLGSFWALIPGLCIWILFIDRAMKEDRALKSELDGYDENASQTRFRLIPGIW